VICARQRDEAATHCAGAAASRPEGESLYERKKKIKEKNNKRRRNIRRRNNELPRDKKELTPPREKECEKREREKLSSTIYPIEG